MCVPDHHMGGVYLASVPECITLLRGVWREMCGDEFAYELSDVGFVIVHFRMLHLLIQLKGNLSQIRG
jgi:hypothetical protein